MKYFKRNPFFKASNLKDVQMVFIVCRGFANSFTKVIDETIKGHRWGIIELRERSALGGMSFMRFTKFIRFL